MISFLNRKKEEDMNERPPLDISAIEDELQSAADRIYPPRTQHPYDLDQRLPPPPLPEDRRMVFPTYSSNDPTANDLGKILSDSLIKEYETSAKSLESMAVELKAVINDTMLSAEELCNGAIAAIDEVNKTVALYRDHAKMVAQQITTATTLAGDVRKTAIDMQGKLQNPEPIKVEVTKPEAPTITEVK